VPSFALGRRRLRYRTAMQRIVLAASLLLASIIVACGAPAAEGPGSVSAASPGAGGGSEVGPGSDVECHEETKTGSSISHQVCRTKFQTEDDRRGAQDMIGQPHTAPTPTR
jgi:hypothetical protein